MHSIALTLARSLRTPQTQTQTTTQDTDTDKHTQTHTSVLRLAYHAVARHDTLPQYHARPTYVGP
eukprot:3494465-Rhodomonas_salina.1